MQPDRVSVWTPVTFDVLHCPSVLANLTVQHVVVVVERRSGVIAQPTHDALLSVAVGASLHRWSDKSLRPARIGRCHPQRRSTAASRIGSPSTRRYGSRCRGTGTPTCASSAPDTPGSGRRTT